MLFSDHDGMKLEINPRKKKHLERTQISGRLKNMLLNNKWVNKEIKDQNKTINKNMKTMKMKTQWSEVIGTEQK